jgi:hypothetical protein
MTKLSDFERILADAPMAVPALAAGVQAPLPNFDTPDRLDTEPAVLMYVMRGPLAGTAAVEINGVNVGAVSANGGSAFNAQKIAVDGARLNNGSNTISIVGPSAAFDIKDVYCFYHKSCACP